MLSASIRREHEEMIPSNFLHTRYRLIFNPPLHYKPTGLTISMIISFFQKNPHAKKGNYRGISTRHILQYCRHHGLHGDYLLQRMNLMLELCTLPIGKSGTAEEHLPAI
jgi:hypothetical protein